MVKEPKIYIFDEEKEVFKEVFKINHQDVAFIVFPRDSKVIIWEGTDAPRVKRYKAGMKVTSLISSKQLFGFKHEVVEDGAEPEDVQHFLADKFGKRDLSSVEIAREDRKQAESKARQINQKYAKTPASAAPPRAIQASVDSTYFQLKEDFANVQKAEESTYSGEVSPSVQDRIRERNEKHTSVNRPSKFSTEPEVQQELAENDENQEKETPSESKPVDEAAVPEEPEEEHIVSSVKQRVQARDSKAATVTTATKAPKAATIPSRTKTARQTADGSAVKQELLKLSSKGTSRDAMSLDKKKMLTPDERKIEDEARQGQSRADNEMSVQGLRMIDQDRKQKISRQERDRQQIIQADKRKTDTQVQQRVARDKQAMEQKLRAEKDQMEQERQELQEKLQRQEEERHLEEEERKRAREAMKEEIKAFEIRKINLRMQLRKEGVDYLAPPEVDTHVLYRIEQGTAIPMPVEYLTSGDVYLLDAGSKITVWKGGNASLDEKFFGEEIAKLLKQKRGTDVTLSIIDQFKETPDFLTAFKSLQVIEGDFAQSELKLEDVHAAKNFALFRIKSEVGLLFHEMPKDHSSITSNDSFLFDLGNRIIIWHGKDASLAERNSSETIAELFRQERGESFDITIIEEGKEPAHNTLPNEVWVILKGEDEAASLRDSYERAVNALEQQRLERERKKQEQDAAKRVLDDKKTLEQMERIERQMLQKEIDRKKDELTQEEIETKWADFRRKMRVRRGLPEEEEAPSTPARAVAESGDVEGEAAAAEEVEPAQAEPDIDAIKAKKEKEYEQLVRIETEMLEKKIQKEQPDEENEAALRQKLQNKLDARRAKMFEGLE